MESPEANTEIPQSKTTEIAPELTADMEKPRLTDEEIDSLIAEEIKDGEKNKEIERVKREMGIDLYSTNEEIKGNYDGDWTLLLMERMKNPASRKKFIAAKVAMLTGDAPYDVPESKNGLNLVKLEQTKKYHYDQIRNYDDVVDRAFSFTTYGPASQYGKAPKNLGSSGNNGTVFTDAESKGRELGIDDKNLIEAHEKGHVLRSFKTNGSDIRKGFDLTRLPEEYKHSGYLSKPDELAERMSQLKNYFGFKGDEKFTRQHLAYAKEHYLKNGKLDNDMSEFFAMVTPDTEDEFLRIINEYPI